MLSYAQNLEDVMLSRALVDVQNGCWIDVGAGDPISDSVTKHFYEAGWRGINVEPHPNSHSALLEDREEDINLQLMMSNKSQTEIMYFFDQAGFSTANPKIAKYHIGQGLAFSTAEMKATTLNDLWSTYVNNREVHFLKIDVEGNEKKVLEGINLLQNRPWIIVIESTFPNTQIDSYAEWETLVLKSNYEMVYRDGLNRFYLAKERIELKGRFEFPPNVFDNYEQRYGYREVELKRLQEENFRLIEKLNHRQTEFGENL